MEPLYSSKGDIHDFKDLSRHDFNFSRPLALIRQGMDSVQEHRSVIGMPMVTNCRDSFRLTI